MYKVLWLLKGQPGVTPQQFREWYETSHAVMAQKYFGEHLIEYRRNYVDDVAATKPNEYTAPPEEGETGVVPEGSAVRDGGAEHPAAGEEPFAYLCVTEWVMADEAAFDSIMSVFADPEIGPLFTADSRPVMSPQTVLVRVSEFETVRDAGSASLAPGEER